MNILTWAMAVRTGIETLARMFISGELSISQAWVAVRGATVYVARLAAGEPEASPVCQRERAVTCATCYKRGQRNIGNGVTAIYCGTPFLEDRQAATCGCLVALTRDGVPYAAGKVTLASESCPSGFWGVRGDS